MAPLPEPAEFSIEDAILNTWVEESGDYLRLELPEDIPAEPPPRLDSDRDPEPRGR